MKKAAPKKASSLQIDAIFCDCATVREGLLHVLGGGITRIFREHYPALMNLHLAMVVHCPPELTGQTHQMSLTLRDPQSSRLAEANVSFSVTGLDDGEEITVPMTASFQHQILPAAGVYELELAMAGKTLRKLRLQARLNA
ncbi:MAG: hypothetical protein U0931_30315 [Vulcanimicrobiota bacterium]